MGNLQRKLTNFRIRRYAKRRERAFHQHFSTLSHEERQQLTDGTHPSQSHTLDQEAEPFALALQRKLQNDGWPSNVKVGYYHLDRIVLLADLAQPPRHRRLLPRFFHGFEIKYNWPSAAS